ncbi:NAD-dependent epimerase/dehydratase family protein [Nocardioides bigeumensis]|uniref:SDR family oxidoreductase n=1 Tax=Nocardioides bigeumensis TaxID=433657 RepID=A0ABN2XJR6_9ACTN
MRILIIGGTRFVGHAMAEAALDAGHDVTLLHRNPTDELPGATHLLADRNDDLSVLTDGEWDATIDVCAYVPDQVTAIHDALGVRGGHHVFVSTVSVYVDQEAPGADEDAELFPEPAPGTTEVTNETYGPLKVACERVARERWGDRLTIIRPTYVVGPRDMTGRYPWWVLRAARGGTMLLPGPADAPMQCIDARDMGAWTIRLVEDGTTGIFTAARPTTSFGELVSETVAAVGVPAELVEVDGAFLVEQGVDGAQLPLWSEGAAEQVLAMSTARAEAAGLTHRPFAEVVRDTLAWAQAHPDLASRDGLGLAPEREAELIDAAASG